MKTLQLCSGSGASTGGTQEEIKKPRKQEKNLGGEIAHLHGLNRQVGAEGYLKRSKEKGTTSRECSKREKKVRTTRLPNRVRIFKEYSNATVRKQGDIVKTTKKGSRDHVGRTGERTGARN